MTEWRWDQGRILYFQYDVLKEIARVLVKYDGMNINDNQIAQNLKADLISSSGLPFLPEIYKINRNYSRVFQCALLSTTKGKGELVVSDICKELAYENSAYASADDYLFEVINHFRFPFPAFQEYSVSDERIYPFCAIIKFLISKKLNGKEASLSIDDIGRYIIGNQCTGLEDVEYYKNLQPTSYELKGDSLRQVREMVVFIGQLSFLKIYDRKVYLDVIGIDDANILLDQLLAPVIKDPLSDKVEEFISITSLPKIITSSNKPIKTSSSISLPTADISDIEFAEGKRKRVHHLRIERSPMLRRLYIKLHPEPICDACKENIKERYPWTDYMLDLHHLLPLSSVIRTLESGTSITDMVGLCPSCHRAIHSYYSKWLKANSVDDFRSKKEAMEVYLAAIKEIA